jgi:hypothetical protein
MRETQKGQHALQVDVPTTTEMVWNVIDGTFVLLVSYTECFTEGF